MRSGLRVAWRDVACASLAVMTVAAVASTAGCQADGTRARGGDDPAAALEGVRPARGSTGAATITTTTTTGSAPTVATGPGAAPSPTPAPEVAALLLAYDRALTDLAAQPAAAGEAAHPLLAAWWAVVTRSSDLDQTMRSRLLAQAAEGTVIRPDIDGLSWRDRARAVRETPDGAVSWENCGFSPGIGVDAATGEVRDDQRASTRGYGRAHRAPDGHLVLDELVQEDFELLGPEASDPCVSGGWR